MSVRHRAAERGEGTGVFAAQFVRPGVRPERHALRPSEYHGDRHRYGRGRHAPPAAPLAAVLLAGLVAIAAGLFTVVVVAKLLTSW